MSDYEPEGKIKRHSLYSDDGIVDAVLKLAEQQRIANLIALVGDTPDHRVADQLYASEEVAASDGTKYSRYTSLLPNIAATLGITAEA